MQTIVDRDGSVRLRDDRSGVETRVVGRAAVMLRWHVQHAAELDVWSCPTCGALVGAMHWREIDAAPSHYVCPEGHVSLAVEHHAPKGELLN
jgi:hypothetical protein